MVEKSNQRLLTVFGAAPPHSATHRMIDFREFFQARIASRRVRTEQQASPADRRFHDRRHARMRSGDNHRKKPC